MRVLMDGDGCPVVRIAAEECKKRHIECLVFCDTAHEMRREDITLLTFDKGADSVDYALAGRVRPGDIVVTQDYGVASMCLARGAQVLHQDGWEYTQWNIDALLLERHEAQKFRQSGGRTKGASKRKREQDQLFRQGLVRLLETVPREG